MDTGYSWSALLFMTLMVQWIVGILALTMQVITANGPPLLTSEVEKYRIGRAGDRLRLICPVNSNPAPIFEWAKDGQVIHAAWERHRIKDDQLYIRDLELDDTGIYTCRVTNGFGKLELTFLVYVSPVSNHSIPLPALNEEYFKELYGKGEPPSFAHLAEMERHRHVTTPLASTLRLRCRVTGRPRPQIQWFKDGKMISDDSETIQRTKDSRGGGDVDEAGSRWMLEIDDVTSQHGGVYECRASNKAGVANFTYHVDVIGIPSGNEPVPPLLSAVDESQPQQESNLALHIIIAVTSIISAGIVFTALVIVCTCCRMSRREGVTTELHSRATSLPLITTPAHKQYSTASSPSHKQYPSSSHSHRQCIFSNSSQRLYSSAPYGGNTESEHSYAVLEPPMMFGQLNLTEISQASGKFDLPCDACIVCNHSKILNEHVIRPNS